MDDEQVARGTDVVRLDFPDCDIWIRASSPAEKNWRTRSCAKEPWTVEWLRGAVRPGEVLYDVGANVGTYALVAAKHAQARVVAFEPGYANFARLCDNIRLNGCQHAIVPVPLPLAERSGLVGFTYRGIEPGQSRHKMKSEPWRFRGAAAGTRYEQPLLAMTLDAMIAAFDLPRPHHLKIDVDGAEDRVLAGAPDTLRSETLRTVLIEVDRVQWSGVSSLLERAGLSLDTRIERRKADAPEYGLFVRRPAPHRPSRWWTFLHNTSRP
ncbi:MAG TPA: FkbM family methyltransferase [Vicinamibacterales bacterium]|nr:FkbM family methyltransferase [Vicinamibacterales bacterium]